MAEIDLMCSCEICGFPMVEAGKYDPDGEIALHGGHKEYKDGQLIKWFVCINPECKVGGRNNGRVD